MEREIESILKQKKKVKLDLEEKKKILVE